MSERRSPQKIFDVAYKGLASQGFRQSRTSNMGWCAYRGEGGLKCAVGHLINDENYNVGLEGLASDMACVMKAAGVQDCHKKLLADMQEAHDGDFGRGITPDEMKSRLADVATEHGLQVPEVSA